MGEENNWIEAGSGQEAYVLKGSLAEIEGIGGVVKSEKPILVAKRISLNKPIHDYEGNDLFCKHLCAKLLENLFITKRVYSKEHIPVPLGSFNGGYYYEFVEGSEGFPLEIMDDEYRPLQVDIEEFVTFVNFFGSFGFKIGHDIAEANDSRIGKNIILAEWNIKEVYDTGKLHSNWKRIDFGTVSCPFNYETFEKEMSERKPELINKMGQDYWLALFAAKYHKFPDNVTIEENAELESLILQFRMKNNN